MADDDPDRDIKSGAPEERIIKEAKRRFKRCEDWESKARSRFVQDVKFANGDSDNFWQWADAIRNARELDQSPCLTINKVRQHNLQIINDARQNKPSVAVKAVGNGATYEAAQVFEGVVRHIEYQSNAQQAYDTATVSQVEGGIGYWRIATDYADDDSFDQEIFIRRVKDPLSIYLDPDIKELDGSDARFGFVFDDIEREEFDAKYPQYKDYASADLMGNVGETSWLNSTKVRMAEYFRVVDKKDKLVALTDPDTGDQIIAKASEVPKELRKVAVDDPSYREREISTRVVERYLLVGDKIVETETTIWPGKWIPIIRVVGEETQIEGEMDRRGHTRAMKDPQRIYNYWSSSAVEMVALQSKTPYIGPMSAFENLENYWDTANRVNHAWLPYNGYDDKGQPIQAPQRQTPPVMAQAYLQGMTVSSEELRSVSGQYQAEMGAPSNEKSGVAILQRQRQGDNATYHFIDHLAAAIRFTGKQLIDLIPKIYDTPRIIKIMAEDGVETSVKIDPNAQQAYVQQQKQQSEMIEAIFNPQVGKYDVEADIGPAYATRRQEAFNAFMEIARGNPEIMKVAGDLMFKAADFPMANELAERIKRTIPPQILGDGPNPEIEQMQQQTQAMQMTIQNLIQQLADKEGDLSIKREQKEIDAFKAMTDRLEMQVKTLLSPREIAQMVHEMAKAEHAAQIDTTAIDSEAEMPAPQPGAVPQGAQPQQMGMGA
jgi:hypothetical protein